MKPITVLGGGAWGTAIASLLATNGNQVNIWCFEPEVVDTINNQHKNERYLPGIDLPPNVRATTDLKEALSQSDLICEAIPVAHLRNVLNLAKAHIHAGHRWLVLSKGIEQDTLLLPTQIIDVVIGNNPKKAVLSGPSFARDLG
jgi:glycerol-3-phosphate dehydrogenase (NAD(P)+)